MSGFFFFLSSFPSHFWFSNFLGFFRYCFVLCFVSLFLIFWFLFYSSFSFLRVSGDLFPMFSCVIKLFSFVCGHFLYWFLFFSFVFSSALFRYYPCSLSLLRCSPWSPFVISLFLISFFLCSPSVFSSVSPKDKKRGGGSRYLYISNPAIIIFFFESYQVFCCCCCWLLFWSCLSSFIVFTSLPRPSFLPPTITLFIVLFDLVLRLHSLIYSSLFFSFLFLLTYVFYFPLFFFPLFFLSFHSLSLLFIY